MFGILDDIVDTAIDLTSSTVSKAVNIGTLGAVDLDKENIAKYLAAGYTLYELSEVTGVALHVLESMMED